MVASEIVVILKLGWLFPKKREKVEFLSRGLP